VKLGVKEAGLRSSVLRNRKCMPGLLGCKSKHIIVKSETLLSVDIANRRIRDPYARWREGRSPFLTRGGPVYSISFCLFYLIALMTFPPFITNSTRDNSEISSRGFSLVAIISANLPTLILPISSSLISNSAFTFVPAMIA